MILDYIWKNIILLTLPSIIGVILWLVYFFNRDAFQKIDKSVSCFANKVIVIFILTIMSIILLGIKNPLLVVICMVATGIILHFLLILINSAKLVDEQRRSYRQIIKEECEVCKKHKKWKWKRILNGFDAKDEINESKRRNEILGCATITILSLAIYSFHIEEGSVLAYTLLSYLTGKFMWLDGGIVEGVASIFYYIKVEWRTVFCMALVWGTYHLFIEVLMCDISALYIGLIPVVTPAVVLLIKYWRKYEVNKTKPQ